MVLAGAIWLPLAAPLLGAALLALPGSARARRQWWDAVTLLTVGLTAVGLGCAVAAWPVIGQPTRFEASLGVLDPGGGAAGTAWSLASAGLGGVFLAVALRARSRLLVLAASAQLGISVLAVAAELLHPATSTVGPGTPATGSLAVDPLAITLLGVAVIVGGLITVYAVGYEPAHLEHAGLDVRRTPVFLAWLLVFIAAMNLLVLADDLRLLVFAWELTTLCSFVLIGFDGGERAVSAARRALAYSLLGGIALAAAALLAGPGGRISGLIAGDAAAPWALPLILAGCVVAAATKSALVPFHPWLLGAMVAAAPVSGLLHASAMVKAGSYLLLRLSPAIAADGLLGAALVVLGGFSFAVSALVALRQRDLKQILACSTISTLGLIAVSAGLGSPAALAAGVLLLAFHAVAKALAFLAVGAIEQVTRTRDLEALVGAARTVPQLAGPLVIAAAALALPPFGLAAAKWALFELGAGDPILIGLLAIGGAAYLAVWTAVVGRLIVRRVGSPARPGSALPRSEGLPIAALSTMSLAGLALAAPIASGLADPAGRAAFGTGAGLAAGWTIALESGAFVVPAIAALGLAAGAIAIVVAGRLGRGAPGPYLAGATVASGSAGAFHGGRGGPVVARSGGFYWGGDGPEAGVLGRLVIAAGWLLVAAIALAAAFGAAGAGPWA